MLERRWRSRNRRNFTPIDGQVNTELRGVRLRFADKQLKGIVCSHRPRRLPFALPPRWTRWRFDFQTTRENLKGLAVLFHKPKSVVERDALNLVTIVQASRKRIAGHRSCFQAIARFGLRDVEFHLKGSMRVWFSFLGQAGLPSIRMQTEKLTSEPGVDLRSNGLHRCPSAIGQLSLPDLRQAL